MCIGSGGAKLKLKPKKKAVSKGLRIEVRKSMIKPGVFKPITGTRSQVVRGKAMGSREQVMHAFKLHEDVLHSSLATRKIKHAASGKKQHGNGGGVGYGKVEPGSSQKDWEWRQRKKAYRQLSVIAGTDRWSAPPRKINQAVTMPKNPRKRALRINALNSNAKDHAAYNAKFSKSLINGSFKSISRATKNERAGMAYNLNARSFDRPGPVRRSPYKVTPSSYNYEQKQARKAADHATRVESAGFTHHQVTSAQAMPKSPRKRAERESRLAVTKGLRMAVHNKRLLSGKRPSAEQLAAANRAGADRGLILKPTSLRSVPKMNQGNGPLRRHYEAR